MTISKIILTTAVFSLAGSGLAAAHDERVERIDDIRASQARSIEQGRYTGELTRREYRELLSEQARIREMEQRAKADGHVSRREFRDIREAQAEANRHINTEAHDGQVSLWRRWLSRHRY